MHNDIAEILVSEEQIDEIAKRLGKQLTEDYKDKYPIVVGLLKGCVPFMGRLITEMNCHLEMEFMDVSSYHGGIKSSGDIQIKKDLTIPVQDRHVIIAEDIVDTGKTIRVVMDLLLYRGAKSVSVVTLLDKPAGRVVSLDPEYIGVTIPNKFVVGYGLDFDEKYRNLPYVGVLKPEVYE
ncbi:hypoxanthine phosphoribosyltransferase [Candidatus Xianfuyuplasma coldseepsis]|uniref:Hypoxanthine phosphoribosyltransferase n=1 Tax=Candidatus Xianfuyuplasma coldseepsis TaxID=2782163 RepID=A0A7L7KQK9_9MOLU|nr:hypoxanthine phosphoribosyltransferase [Xianfuyuplasma coldseepsis]QMS85003.1 hypoxanthine phosphoribosyltransferase [Xianfuyuplasma coldseepsis]